MLSSTSFKIRRKPRGISTFRNLPPGRAQTVSPGLFSFRKPDVAPVRSSLTPACISTCFFAAHQEIAAIGPQKNGSQCTPQNYRLINHMPTLVIITDGINDDQLTKFHITPTKLVNPVEFSSDQIHFYFNNRVTPNANREKTVRKMFLGINKAFDCMPRGQMSPAMDSRLSETPFNSTASLSASASRGSYRNSVQYVNR